MPKTSNYYGAEQAKRIAALEAERDALREIAWRIVAQPWNHIRHSDLLELRQLLERPK